MIRLKDVGVRTKMICSFLMAGLFSLALAGWWGSTLTEEAVLKQATSQLEAVREAKKYAVEQQMANVANQALSFAENSLVIHAVQNFSSAYSNFRLENHIVKDDMARQRRALQVHYAGDYASEYKKYTNGLMPDALNYFSLLEDDAAALQFSYIQDNPFPVGEKSGMASASDGSAYSTLHSALHPFVHQYLKRHGFNDIMLVDAQSGVVLYSVAKRIDFATSLKHGPFSASSAGAAFRLANRAGQKGRVVVTDYGQYPPSYNQPLGFVAVPVYTNDTKVGVVLFEMPFAKLNELVNDRAGLNKTGEVLLVGPDFLLRTDAYADKENRSVAASFAYPKHGKVDTMSVHKALDGETGCQLFTDYAGKEVLSAYAPLNVNGLSWALVAKIDYAEIMQPVRQFIITLLIGAGVLVPLMIFTALIASRHISAPLLKGVKFAEGISSGDLSSTLDMDQDDELGDLARALNNMAENLREQDWLKRGKTGLHESMRGGLTLDEMSKNCIAFLVRHLDAQLGALYLANEAGDLVLTAGFAFTDRKGNFNRIKPGQGMVGQVAVEKTLIIFSAVEEDAPALNYGVGEKVPEHFLIAPILHEKGVVGVVQLGSTNVFTPLQRKYIEQNLESIAISFNSAQSRAKMNELLEYSQEQAEALSSQQSMLANSNKELEERNHALKASEESLQAQQEELRVTNEELAEQTKALRASEEALKTQQEELRVANEELENRSQALVKQKDALKRKNVELKKAQKEIKYKAVELEQSSRYKSEFLANMSHELRTPLNSILILSQILANNKEGSLSPKQLEFASTIHASGSDLLAMINEVLDLSKVEAGQSDIHLGDLNLNEFGENVRRVFGQIAQSKGLYLRATVDEHELPVSIVTDSRRVQQIVHNLITNAFKFTEHGGVALRIYRPDNVDGLKRTDLAPEKLVAFAVKDTGVGVPKSKQNIIFEAFKQADGTTSRKFGGTGLGLSISRELASLLGGEIVMQSEEGEGSVFTLYLPEYLDVEPAGELKWDQGVSNPGDVSDFSEDKPVLRLGREKIQDDREIVGRHDKALLVIEDDPNFARILFNFAHEKGFKCLVAADGETGLHLAREYSPNAVILDIGLPGIDGMTVMEKLKLNPLTRHIPVHIVSAFDESKDAMKMGAVGYITKPVSMEKLGAVFSTLEEVIAKPVKKLLVVEDDEVQRNSIVELIGNGDVETSAVGTGKEAFELLQTGVYDCVILDLGLEDMSGFEFLAKVRKVNPASKTPVVVYTGKELTRDEETELAKYTESIVIKGVRSPERLLDETALFLHRVEADLPKEKQRMIRMVHDKEAVLEDKKVLIVDDDRRNIFAITNILEEKGMRVVSAGNGKECLEKLESNTDVSVVLMDIMMPEMDGYEALRRIRDQQRFRRLPVIALTAKAMKGDRIKCIEAGANDYLAKPVDTDKLLSLLRVWLHQ